MGASDVPRVMLAGFLATLTMTLLWYPSAILTDAPVFDFAAVLGSVVGANPPAVWSGLWWLGMVEHFFDGAVIFPFVYSFVLFPWLPGESVFKGFLFGILLWLGSQITIMPLMGLGLFGERSSNPLMTLFITFNGHLIYGLVLGIVAGKPGRSLAAGSSGGDAGVIEMGGFTTRKRTGT